MKTALLVLLASAAASQPGRALVTPLVPPAGIALRADDPARGPDEARIRTLLAAGDSLQAVGRFDASRRQYRTLIAEQRAATQYPVKALWRLASSYYGQSDELMAASVLDELAQAASQFGDPSTELRATFEAAVLYQKHEQTARVAPKLDRVRSLLRSPVIADEMKKEIQDRMAG